MVSGPLVVNVSELLHHPGQRRTLATSTALAPIVLSAAAVPDGAEVDVEVTLEVQGRQVMVSGTVTAPWEGECRRCLERTGGTVVAPVQEVFEPDHVEGETWPLEADRVDLEPVVHEAVILALPLAPLCSDACAGPDPERFPAVVEGNGDGDGGDDDAPRDPRWAALDQLKFD